MKHLLQVSTQVDKPELLQQLIEKMAIRRNEFHSLKDILPKPWHAIETSSLESYINGSMAITISKDEVLNVPFTANFLFSCIRENKDPYRFNWALSLS